MTRSHFLFQVLRKTQTLFKKVVENKFTKPTQISDPLAQALYEVRSKRIREPNKISCYSPPKKSQSSHQLFFT